MQLSWLVRGLRTGVLATRYPRGQASMPPGWRGVVALDAARCQLEVGLPPCVAVCPSAALWVESTGAEAASLRLDALACVACGRCVPVCPAGALEMLPRFELARLDHPDRRPAR